MIKKTKLGFLLPPPSRPDLGTPVPRKTGPARPTVLRKRRLVEIDWGILAPRSTAPSPLFVSTEHLPDESELFMMISPGSNRRQRENRPKVSRSSDDAPTTGLEGIFVHSSLSFEDSTIFGVNDPAASRLSDNLFLK
jgi:hypothetical protein